MPATPAPDAPTFSPLTGHWSDCATYATLDASDCTCWERPAPRGLDTAANGWEWADLTPGPAARPSWVEGGQA